MPTEPPPPAILVLAPQPFFQHRGTPIAVRLLVRELAALGFAVHLLTYHEGETVAVPGVFLHRIPAIPGLKNIPPSFSWKKIIADVLLFFSTMSLCRRYRFDFIHAVEEAAYIALVVKKIFNTKYVYDMDSSLALQLEEKFAFLRPAQRFLQGCERTAIRESSGVVAVCRELEELARAAAPDKLVARLEDISLLEEGVAGVENLRQSCHIDSPLLLYVGNLEFYQGIDLLLAAIQEVLAAGCQATLVLIGGTPEKIALYQQRARDLGIIDHIRFCGPRPVELLGHYLAQADILLSPRIQGNNTPMKLYSYLDSGRVVLATDLPTHTQVLGAEYACLAAPEKGAMAAAIIRLLDDRQLREKLAEKGRQVAREHYSLAAFQTKLANFYSSLLADQTEVGRRKPVEEMRKL
jgi:glycosyltransferase involved in cell wall biosynthesis